jgi:type IV pilus assembly protein PilB
VEALQTIERTRDNPAAAGTIQYQQMVDVRDERDTGEGATAIVDHLITRAVQMRASDLHIEPGPNAVRVRARVDGALLPLTDLPAAFGPPVASRIKVLAGADIAERRLHQDGRVSLRVERREVDVRVSSYASVFGETLVLRLLDRNRGIVPLEDLGFDPLVLADLRDVVLREASGLVLITGPTGSGKTTTLYSFVDFVNDPSMKVITCEDPVEYVIAGVVQCSVNAKTGPTFADSLRAIVRQDPDVIVVGEIRDPETASLAVEAALTGHKVFCTFHTEDAVGSALRLLEMQIAPFLASSTVSCIIAQRLLRQVCPSCRRAAEPRREDLRYLGLRPADLAGFQVVEGAGCERCKGSGYAGRLGIHEVLIPDDDFRDAVLQRAPSRELRSRARALPRFMSLQESGMLKVAAGRTTFAELASNAPNDPEARTLAALRQLSGAGGGA